MSERQAKLNRKNTENKEITKKKRTTGEIVTNIILIVVVIAFLGVGIWAVASKLKSDKQAATVESQQTEEQAQQQVPTIAQYAEDMGMTSEEFMKEYGLADNPEITDTMEMTLATEYMTVGNYAKMTSTNAEEMISQMGLGDEITENTLMGEVFEKMQQKAAEDAANQEQSSEPEAETENADNAADEGKTEDK